MALWKRKHVEPVVTEVDTVTADVVRELEEPTDRFVVTDADRAVAEAAMAKEQAKAMVERARPMVRDVHRRMSQNHIYETMMHSLGG